MKEHLELVYKARIGVTHSLGLVQAILAVLSMIDKLNSSGYSSFSTLDTLINDSYWGGMFIISSIVVLMGVKYPRVYPAAMSISSGLFLVWGILTLAENLTLEGMNVPIVGGVLSISLGIVSYFMSQIWNSIIWNIKVKNSTMELEGAALAEQIES